MTLCPHCQSNLKDAETCPNCGQPRPNPTAASPQWMAALWADCCNGWCFGARLAQPQISLLPPFGMDSGRDGVLLSLPGSRWQDQLAL